MADQTNLDNNEQTKNIEKLRGLMKGVRIAMLITEHTDGAMHARPMALQEAEFDGDLWFFTSKTSEKINDIRDNNNVCVTFAGTGTDSYVSLSGHAMVMYDKNKIDELWSPFVAAWFPNGKDDPDLTLIKVSAEKAEYWEGTNKVQELFGLLKAAITKQPADDMGKNEQVSLKAPTPTYR